MPSPVPSPAWRAAPWVLLAVTAAVYLPLLGAEFSWDDEALIVQSEVTSSLANIGEFFTRDLWSTTNLPSIESGYYRPLWLLSVAVDRAIFSLSSAASHAHSILWHVGATAALYAVLRRLLVETSGEPDDSAGTPARLALLGAAVFALHPVQSEVLALIAARNDSMATALTLTALWLLLPERVGAGRVVGAALCLLAGLLSKESAVLAPILLAVLDFARWGRTRGAPRYVALFAALAIYGALRVWAGVGKGIVPSASGFRLVAEHALQIAGVYADLVVWPWPLSPARHVHYLPPVREVLFGLVIFLALTALAVLRGHRRRLVLAGLGWALLAWAPSLAATLDKGLLGERYLYFPMAGLAVAVAAALPRLPRWLLPLLGVPAVLAIELRLPQWKDSRTVWAAAHEVGPTAFTAAGYGWYLNRDQDWERALPMLEYALRADPPYHDVCPMIVMSNVAAGRPAEAARIGAWAVRERGCPADPMIVGQQATALALTGRWDDATRSAMSLTTGPGYVGSMVVAASQARKGDLGGLARMARSAHTDPYVDLQMKSLLGEQEGTAKGQNDGILFGMRVGRLLTLAGETEAAARVGDIVRRSRVALEQQSAGQPSPPASGGPPPQ